MALLNRHGIGSGRYKVKGIYGETFIKLDLNRKAGEILYTINVSNIDSSLFPSAVTYGEPGTIYFGGNNGSFNLYKTTFEGEVLWSLPTNRAVLRVLYDEQESAIWTLEENTAIRKYSLEGILLLSIPYTNDYVRNMQITENHLVIGHNIATSTATENLKFYNKDGTLFRNYNIPFMRTFLVDGNYIYYGTNTQWIKIDMDSVQQWAVFATNITQQPTINHYLALDNRDTLYCFSYYRNANNSGSQLFVLNSETGEIIKTGTRSGNSFNPDDDAILNIPYADGISMLGNGINYPTFISQVSGTLTSYTNINENGIVYSQFKVAGNQFNPNQNRHSNAIMDKDKILYVISNENNFGRKITILDAKEYYEIQN